MSFVTGGAITHRDSEFYIERKADKQALRCIERGNYILISEPRQQGKTSLVNRLHYTLHDKHKLIYVDMSSLNTSSETQWYLTLYERIFEQTQALLSFDLHQEALTHTGCRNLLKKLASIAQSVNCKIVISLDEVGTLNNEWTTNFFTTLREVYNSRQAIQEFNNLTFMFVGAFDPANLIIDKRISPFNIAVRAHLEDFSENETQILFSKLSWHSTDYVKIAKEVYEWVAGQPYLTQTLGSVIHNRDTVTSVKQAVQILKKDDMNHWPNIVNKVRFNQDYRKYLRRILGGDQLEFYPSQYPVQRNLELIGLIKGDEDGNCMVRNYFYEHLLTDDILDVDQNNLGNIQKVVSFDELVGKGELNVEDIHTSILHAYPNRGMLGQIVKFSLNRSLESITDRSNQNAIVFDLIAWAESKGQLNELMAGAFKYNPENPKLLALFQRLPPH